MTPVQQLVDDLQQKLGVRLNKGQITLNLANGRFQNAEFRVCVSDPDAQKDVDKSQQSCST